MLDLAVLAPEHRARAVALAAAELVHALSSRASAAAAPAKPPAPLPSALTPAERAQPAEPPRSSPQRPALLVGGLAEWLGRPKTLLLGARLALHYPLGNVVAPAFSVDGALGGFPARSARVTAESLAAAAHLYFGTSTGNLRWEAGPGARFGWVHLAGHPDSGSMLEGRSLAAAWGGPEARARVAYGATELRSAQVALELGAGFVALPVRGLVDGTERLYALEGPWLSVCAEVGIGL